MIHPLNHALHPNR
jgi:hypothetical protein